MPRFNRRRFIEALGLGVTAPLLAPITNTLISEAQGAVAPRRRIALVFVIGEAFHPAFVAPKEVAAGSAIGYQRADVSGITWPAAFEGLAPYKDRTVIVDGLYNRIVANPGRGEAGNVNHGSGFGCLTGAPTMGGRGPEFPGSLPTAPSLDQFIVQKNGLSTPVPSILFGFDGANSVRDSAENTFAAGANKPLRHIGLPSMLYAQLFSKVPSSGATPSPADLAREQMQGSLLNAMRKDIRRLETKLAGSERERLTDYLTLVEDFDRQQAQLKEQLGNCGQFPTGIDGTPVKRLESMFAMSTLAVRCGLTNVVGVSVGAGFGHDDLGLFRADLFGDEGYGGHGPVEVYQRQVSKVYKTATGLMGNMLKNLGPLADSTVMMLTASSGASATDRQPHHANLFRWMTVVYDGTGTMKTSPGGRYLRYGRLEKSAVDLYCSVAHAAGAPTDKFGGSYNTCQGPLPELMA
jgi:hypothetical protein